MWRERALKIVLVLLGLAFVAGVYPLVTSVRDGWQANKEDALPMMLNLYIMLGISLLPARDPSPNRSVIAVAAWANIAHAAVMAVMAVLASPHRSMIDWKKVYTQKVYRADHPELEVLNRLIHSLAAAA